jgi:ABC-type multidrug transport system ATPase subunit
MNSPLLQIKNLSKIYMHRRLGIPIHALQEIDLTINRGEVFSLLGVNGAGKTTLSSILATLHPPTTGDVLFHGKSIYDNITEYRMKLGFVPQKQNLDPLLNVYDNLLFAGRYFLLSEKAIKARIDTLLEQFGLTRYAHYSIDSLSGGNQQRVLIARALIHNPEVIILDEPTVALDSDIRRALWNQIVELKKTGITIILTTHYLEEAEFLSERVCVLHRGYIVMIETVSELKHKYEAEKLEDAFLALVKESQEEWGEEEENDEI